MTWDYLGNALWGALLMFTLGLLVVSFTVELATLVRRALHSARRPTFGQRASVALTFALTVSFVAHVVSWWAGQQ